MVNTSFTATSNSVGTGNFTFNEDVSSYLEPGDAVNAYIIINVTITWNNGQNSRTETSFEACLATYLGNSIFTRDIVKASSNIGQLVDFPPGLKSVFISKPDVTTSVTRVYQEFTATDSQTVFTVTDGYDVNKIDVFYNGVHLAEDEYTQDGTDVTLSVGAIADAIIEVVGYK